MTKHSHRIVFLVISMLLAAAAQLASKDPAKTGAKLTAPSIFNPNLYPANADAKADIKAALAQAAKEKKNVLLDFGAMWCIDCHVLDKAFEEPGTKQLWDSNYVLVHIDVGRMDKNVDVAKKYGVVLTKGIPALAVVTPKGKVLVSHKAGEFQAARRMTMADVTAFLEKWKPRSNGKKRVEP
ncbi:MAG TPA: thioredoxin family protein [Terriglobales bacterium]|nr:thioredoxin family protein [Terriglobales bacterium]